MSISEEDRFNVFICGSLSVSSKQEESAILQLYRSVKNIPGINVVNEDTLLKIPTNKFNPTKILDQIEQSLDRAHCAVVDVSYCSPETIAQMSLADRNYNLPLGVFCNDNITPRLPLFKSSLGRIYQWEDGRLLNQQVIQYLRLQRLIRSAKGQQTYFAEGSNISEDIPSSERYVRTGTLTFDYPHDRVLHLDKEVEVEPRSNIWALFLARRIGSITSIDDVQEYAKSMGINISWKTMRDQIRRLVWVINQYSFDPKFPYIETLYNQGYRVQQFSVYEIFKPEMVSTRDLEIDVTNKGVWKDGDRVRLGPTESELLVLLASGKGESLKKEILFEEIWPGSSDQYQNLKRTVVSLRRKIGDTGPNWQYIKTTEDGYCLVL